MSYVLNVVSKKVVDMKKGEYMYLDHIDNHAVFLKNFFYNNSIIYYDSINTGFHAANRNITDQYPLLHSTFRHVKVCVPLITSYVEELYT